MFRCKFLFAVVLGGLFACVSGGGGETSPGDFTISSASNAFDLPTGKGALWMPLTWTLRLNSTADPQLGDPLSQMRLRGIELVLVNTATKAQNKVPMKTLREGAGNSVALTFEDPSRTLGSKRVVALDPGTYRVSHVSGVYIDAATERPQNLELPLPNPREDRENPSMVVTVAEGKVAVVGRLAFASVFGLREGRLTSQMRAESLEPKMIVVQPALDHLSWSVSKQSLLVSATGGSQPLRYIAPVLNSVQFDGHHRNVGFTVEVPCDTKGTLKFVWKNEDRSNDTVAAVPLHAEPAACNGGRLRLSRVLQLPEGNWLLVATEMITEGEEMMVSRIPQIQEAKPEVLSYYGLKRFEDLRLGSPEAEQQLKRRFYLPLKKLGLGVGDVSYLGSFSLDVNAAESKQGKKAWNVLLQKQYELEQLRAQLGSRRIFNPYVGGELASTRKVGKVESLLEISANAKKTKSLAPHIAKIRKAMTEAYADCVQEREKSNPLVVARGKLQFKAQKGQRVATLTQWEFEKSKEGSQGSLSTPQDEDFLKTCFRKKFDTFRFEKVTPASFEANMTLDAF